MPSRTTAFAILPEEGKMEETDVIPDQMLFRKDIGMIARLGAEDPVVTRMVIRDKVVLK